jgi:alpha-beta hydrolase superfamily lysophospholipase
LFGRLSDVTEKLPAVRPIVLGTEPDPVLAFLNEPAASDAKATAVLLCPPFGWYEMCSYRARRAWAQALAQNGYWAARFDLPSTSDSGGAPRDPERLDAWTSAVSGVATWLRETAGASRVVAIGIELGGALACRAVAQGAPIDDLLLWAVPSRGARLLREMRAAATMIAATYPEDDRPVAGGDLQLTGYVLSAATAAALEGLRLTVLQLPGAADRRVMLLGRDGLGFDERLRAYFESAGAEVTVGGGDDYGEMMIHPQQALSPKATIAASIAWLDAGPAAVGEHRQAVAAAPPERDGIEVLVQGTAVRETPVLLRGESGDVFAVLSENSEAGRAPFTLVLLNGGMVRHTGPNRAWVEIARRWAARGLPVVRVDLDGIGESDGELERPIPDRCLYTAEQIAQTRSVLEQLAERGMRDRFVVVGLCSGAYWGLHAALADPRVIALLAVNLYCFFWDDLLPPERDRRASVAALRGGIVKRARAGRVTLRHIRRGLQSFRPRRSGLGVGKSVEDAQTPEIELALDRLRDQHTELLLLLGESEPLMAQLMRQGLIERMPRWPNTTLERIPSRDHMFRALWLQDHVHELLDRTLDRLLATEQAGGGVTQR